MAKPQKPVLHRKAKVAYLETPKGSKYGQLNIPTDYCTITNVPREVDMYLDLEHPNRIILQWELDNGESELQ